MFSVVTLCRDLASRSPGLRRGVLPAEPVRGTRKGAVSEAGEVSGAMVDLTRTKLAVPLATQGARDRVAVFSVPLLYFTRTFRLFPDSSK